MRLGDWDKPTINSEWLLKQIERLPCDVLCFSALDWVIQACDKIDVKLTLGLAWGC